MNSFSIKSILIVVLIGYTAGQLIIQNLTLTAPRKSISSVVVEDAVHFIGGFDTEFIATSMIEVYNISDGNWSTLTLPSPRGFVTPLVLDPNLFLIGGYDMVSLPYVYSPLAKDFVQITNNPGITVRNPDQIALFESTLVVIGDDSIDFLDINTTIWSHNASLAQLMNQYPDTNVIVTGNVILFLALNHTTSAWTYNVLNNQLTHHDGIFNDTNRVVLNSKSSHGVVFVTFDDRSVAYNVALNAWFTFYDINIDFEVHAGNYTYVHGDSKGVQFYGWKDGTYGYNGASTINLYFTVGHYLCYAKQDYLYVLSGNSQQFAVPFMGQPSSYARQPVGTALGDSTYIFTNLRTLPEDAIVVHLLSIPDKSISDIYVTSPSYPVDQIVALDSNRAALFIGPLMLIYNASQQSFTNSTINFIPTYLIANQFISLMQSFPVSDPSSVTNFMNGFYADQVAVSQSGDSLVVMPKLSKPRYYAAVDIYNYRTKQWTVNATSAPDLFRESFGAAPQIHQFFAAALIGDEALLWSQSTLATYNLTSHLLQSNTSVPSLTPTFGIGSIFNLEPVIDRLIYFYNNGDDYFTTVDGYTLAQSTTAAISSVDGSQSGSSSKLQQRVEYNNKIYALNYDPTSSLYDAIYVYDPSAAHWDSTLLPFAVPYAAMALAEDLIIVFTSNSTLFHLYIPNGSWNAVEVSFNFIPSVAVVSNSKLVIGGGVDPLTNNFNDQVYVLNITFLYTLVNYGPPSANTSSPSSDGGITKDSPLIAAIVVPIVAVVAAGVVVLIVLLRRRDKKRKNSVSMVGLEAKFGEWFTPFSDIQFEEQLGQGANGQVFKGRWRNTQVALKVSMTQANTSVVSELSLMINMRPHPNIVQLFGFSVHPETNSIILILEFCNGGSLDTTLFDEKNHDTLTLERKITWLKGVAGGISHLHSNNVIHRDLAARNILLHNDEAKVTDFGMSRLVDEQQQRGTTKSELGPIRWMAPEALKSKQYSTKSDVWSFGILMFEVITQQEPHTNEDPITIGRLIRDEGKTPEIPATCPPALAALMRSCWKMHPDERPSFEILIDQLDRL